MFMIEIGPIPIIEELKFMYNYLYITLFLMMPFLIIAGDRLTGKNFATRSEVIAQNGMAATSQPLATQAAIDILKKGGSAIDAAIAANAVLGLVEPVSCGIGGDLFAIVWDAETEKLYGLNASGRSPQNMTLQHFKNEGLDFIPYLGPLTVSVPGCVDGWFELHKKFGNLKMKDILQPAINYARDGFPVTEVIAYQWQVGFDSRVKFPGFKETFGKDGKALQKGEIFTNSNLAATLEKIAVGGRDVFYRGEIAESMEIYLAQNGGFLTQKDLANHTSDWVEPVSTNYRGYDVWELPPNGQGIAVLQILNILEKYDIASLEFGSKEHIHYFTEAKKLAYEDRAKFYADPAFNQIPVEQLISKAYADERRKLITNRAAKKYDSGNPILENGDTIYLTVADKDGNMISLIQSNYGGFGSGMTPSNLGFCLQNRGQLFNLQEGHFNTYEPNKRPFHTIIPSFITKNGKPWLSFGVMGGAMQPQGHVQIILNLIDFGMNLQEAGDAPRIRHTGSSQPTGEKMTNGGTVNLEHGFDAEVIRELDKIGHHVKFNTGGYGGYQAILWDEINKVYIGASESRKDGHAAGY
jgi:gamma-glutamyltranspeptidase / glutathione hydrolase